MIKSRELEDQQMMEMRMMHSNSVSSRPVSDATVVFRFNVPFSDRDQQSDVSSENHFGFNKSGNASPQAKSRNSSVHAWKNDNKLIQNNDSVNLIAEQDQHSLVNPLIPRDKDGLSSSKGFL